jgi:uncharacterized protein YjgD (DUF1641 family)
MVDKVTQANKKIAAQSAKTASGPVGAKMIEMLDVPSFAKGLTPQILIDLAKSKNIITKEQQADFKNRVGKDRTALAEFNEIVTKADEPRLAYKGQSPVQIEMLRAKSLTPPTRFNQPERIDILKSTHTYINEAAAMDAPKEVKEKTFLDSMRKKFGDFADNPVVRKIASRALMILGAFPTALDFIPMSLLEEGMDMMDQEVPEAAKGGMMNINDITKPLGYKNAGEVGIREKVIEAIQSGKGNLIDKGFFISPEDIYKGMTKKEIERQKEINKIMTDKFTVDPYEGMSEEKKEEIKRKRRIQRILREKRREEMGLPDSIQLLGAN